MRKLKSAGVGIILLILLTLLMAGCGASFDKYVYQSLAITKIAQDTSGRAIARLYLDGVISKDVYDNKFTPINDKFVAAWNTTYDALVAYRAAKTADKEQQLSTAYEKLGIVIIDLNKLVAEFTKKKE
jgi:hypothetical protein